MAAATEMKITFGFADESKRDLKIGPFKPTDAAISGMKTNIISFNSDDVDDIAGLLLSDDGASCTGIVAGSYTTLEKRDINLND